MVTNRRGNYLSACSCQLTRRVIVSLFVLFVVCNAYGQSPTPSPDNKRGLGIEGAPSKSEIGTSQTQTEAKPELVLQTGYNNYFGATRLLFSPDGRLVATTTMRSSTVKLWETATGRELRDLTGGGQSGITFSPLIAFSRDSRFIAATSSADVKVWDVITGREVQTLAGQTASALSAFGLSFLSFGADSKTFITVSDSIRIWDVGSGQVVREFPVSSLSVPNFIGGEGGFALSPDASQMAVIASDGSHPRLIILDLKSGKEVRSVSLPQELLNGAESTFTNDGRLLLAATIEKKLKLWDATGKLSERDLGPTQQEYSLIKFGAQGHLISLSEGYAIKTWETTSGRALPTINVAGTANLPMQSLVFPGFNSDGKKVAISGFGAPTQIWDTETGKPIVGMKGRSNMAYEVSFNADGTQIISGGRTHWDLRTGRGLRVSPSVNERLFGLPSTDGKFLAQFTMTSPTVNLIDTATGQVAHNLTPANPGSAGVNRVMFSPDGRLLTTTYLESDPMHGDAPDSDALKKAMKAAGRNPSDAMRIYQDQMSQLNATKLENQVKIWDVATGRELQTLSLGQMPSQVIFNADSQIVATLLSQGQITLWDAKSGNRLRDLSTSRVSSPFGGLGPLGNLTPGTMPNMADIASMVGNALGAVAAGTAGANVTSLSFSPDGKVIAAGGVDTKSNFDPSALMNMGKTPKKGSKQPNYDPQEMMKNIKLEVTGQVRFFDAVTGSELGTLRGHGKGVNCVAFSRDGQLLASSSTDNSIKIWDVNARRELRTLVGHTASINSMAFSPDSSLLVSASEDGGTFLWDVKTGAHLLTMISLDDGGEWMVVTPEGLFDGTPQAWNQILWRYGGDTFNVAPIELYFNEFYYPGLLADVFNGQRPRVARDVSKRDRRQPRVDLLIPGVDTANGISNRAVKVRLDIAEEPGDKDHKQGSGARDVRLFRNGSLVKVWHGDVLQGKSSVTLEQEISIVAGANQLTVYAFNNDSVKSTDAALVVTGADTLKRPGTAYVIVVGVNEYANNGYNLKYAVADAKSFAEEFRLRQTQLNKFGSIEIVTLLDQEATKANVLAALGRLAGDNSFEIQKGGPIDRLKRAEPEDAVIVYFAGHGTAQGQRFYLIPHDLGYTGPRTRLNEQGLQSILTHSISDIELEQSVESLDAGHLLFVIDACNSGQALEAEEKRRGPMNSKGLAQLAYEKGMYILTAAQSYQAALEATQLGHGLLTYALVEEGLKTDVADTEPKDGVLNAREWLDFAEARVPQMQQEKMKQSRGVGIDIVFVEDDSRTVDPSKRSVQRPRVFYRRELEANPFVVARP